MVLTPQDLRAIGDLIDQKLEEKLEQKLEEKLDQKLEEKLEQKLEEKFEQKLKPIRKELRKIKRTLDESISFFDREIIDHAHRLDNLENYINLTRTKNLR